MILVIIVVVVTIWLVLLALFLCYGFGVYSVKSTIGGISYGAKLMVKYLSDDEQWSRAYVVGVDRDGRILTQRPGEDHIRRVIALKPFSVTEFYEENCRN